MRETIDSSQYSLEFSDVQGSENVQINARRKYFSRELRKAGYVLGDVTPRPVAAQNLRSSRDEDAVLDTVGLTLSGGGIRSAAFCLGALQALDVAGVFSRIDYLSTVSGGGYIGSTLSAGLQKTQGVFFLPSILGDDEPPGVQHLRDYSNYLIPHGVFNVWQSAAIYLRGLAANVALVLPYLLLAALLTLAWHPTRQTLLDQSPSSLLHLQFFYYAILAAILLFGWLIVWALIRSLKISENWPDVPNWLTNVVALWLIFILVAAFCEFQPFFINALLENNESTKSAGFLRSFVSTLQKAVLLLTPVAGAIGFFGNKLGWLIKQGVEKPTVAARIKAVASALALYAAALIVPLLLWICYLELCYWAIGDENLVDNKPVYLAPEWILSAANHFTPQWILSAADRLTPQWIFSAADHLTPWLTMLPWHYLTSLLTILSSEIHFTPISTLYLTTAILLFVISWIYSPNGNSLHRLYRDRLGKAFLFEPMFRLLHPDDSVEAAGTVPLTSLANKFAPYHIINAALNIQASQVANRRGRNADFFMFSGNYVGSKSTGYVATSILQQKEGCVDLATAMAISGAAASSNMGTSSIKSWTASLAMLNVRLGYWMRNPAFLAPFTPVWSIVQSVFNLYFFYEMFGLLNEKRWYVYLTDGGHVENLGIYELLKRRCQLIVAIDAEADPNMNFNSLIGCNDMRALI